MSSTKRQKDMTPEDKPPRLEGVQYASGEEQRAIINCSRKNEMAGPKRKWHSVVGLSGGESKVWCCKEQYCIGTWKLGPLIKVNWMWSSSEHCVHRQDEMARVNILGVSELKWTGMGKFNSYDHYIYYCGQKSLRRNGVTLIVNKRAWNAVVGCNLKNDRMSSLHFQGQPLNIIALQVQAQPLMSKGLKLTGHTKTQNNI